MTRRIIAVGLLVLACVTLALEPLGVAERPLFVDHRVLEFSSQTDQKVYRVEDDAVRLSNRIKNRSDYLSLSPLDLVAAASWWALK